MTPDELASGHIAETIRSLSIGSQLLVSPQIGIVLLLLSGGITARYVVLALGFAYAALILSFLGGLC